ncbi:Hypothetical protein NTJ_10025 [Nesidiocoris tenuis]|uniref:Protein ZIP4 homolog n=1 Tax=Nesidiocoris tenuis TaxID=355587 RepID=A0ABN7AYE8_9HEMI|nr:Hypothetical protein NTJ_10025 [Nesidiocoris tenuis]
MTESLKRELELKLAETECPASWPLKLIENSAKNMIDKLQDKNEEIAGQLWRNVVLEIAICYECCSAYQYPIASQKLQDCLTWIENSAEDFMQKYKIPLKHLVLSFKAFVAIQRELFSEAKRCLENLVGLKDMKVPELAAIAGLKSSVFSEYGIKGTEEALKYVRQALQLDGTEPEWHFALGKLLLRTRNFTLVREPSKEEIDCLERAFKMNSRPHTMVFLAECYVDQGKFIFHSQPLVLGKRVLGPGVESALETIFRKALILYRDASKLNNDQCLHIMIRCARGFAILPDKFQNVKLAMALAHKALKKSPSNVMILSTLSLICRIVGNHTEAIINAKRSADGGAFGSYLRLLDLYHDAKKDYDLEDILAKILDRFPFDLYRLQVYIYALNYYLFVKRDLFKSLPYFEKALELDPKFNLLKHRYVRWVKVNLNLYEVVYNEISCAIKKESFVNDAERKTLMRVRAKVVTLWPPVDTMTIDGGFINKLMENKSIIRRGRTITRRGNKNVGKSTTKKKNNNTKQARRLQSTQSARSTEGFGQKRMSSSYDRNFQGECGQLEPDNNPRNKRPLSHDGRSCSSGAARRKQLKELQTIKKTLSELNLKDPDDCLRPEGANRQWGSFEALQEKPPQVSSSDQNRGSYQVKPSGNDPSRYKRALSQGTRSASRENGSRKIMREMKSVNDSLSNLSLNDSKSEEFELEKIMAQLAFGKDADVSGKDADVSRDLTSEKKKAPIPARSQSFDKKAAEPGGRYSVEKCEKLFFFPDFKAPKKPTPFADFVKKFEKAPVSASRETLDSDDSLESQMSNLSLSKDLEVGEAAPKRSVSLGATSNLKKNDSIRAPPKVSPFAPYNSGTVTLQNSSHLKPSSLNYASRMKDTSLEQRNRPNLNNKPQGVTNFRPGNFSSRPPSNERRPWLPPGTKTHRRNVSESSVTSTSSVDSDYVCSKFSRPAQNYYRRKQ